MMIAILCMILMCVLGMLADVVPIPEDDEL